MQAGSRVTRQHHGPNLGGSFRVRLVMRITRRSLAVVLIGAGGVLLAGQTVARLLAQDQAPNRREFTIVAKDFQFSPIRVEVRQDDLVKLTVRSEDIAHSFTIDEYRVSKRVPAN